MKRSKHSLSHYHLFSGEMGNLIPAGLMEVLPGDTIQHATSALIRVTPLLAPVMHPVDVRMHHWFVPFRLVWDDWEDFITGGPDGLDASSFPTVDLDTTGQAVGSLADYLGVPAGGTTTQTVSALPFRAYQLVFNEWYRDQDLMTERVIDTTSGADTTTDLTIAPIAWEKDYFTSARPWTQKGAEVSLPLTGSAPITGLGIDSAGTLQGVSDTVKETEGTGTISYSDSWQGGNLRAEEDPDNAGYPNIYANLDAVTAATVNDLRLALALQRYEEARARYGSRYTEYLRYLGVKSSDARLQRPEYLGGGRQNIQFSEVLQTAEGTTTNVGELRGHGIGAMRSNRYRRFFEEHGLVLSFLSVRPKTVYMQGLNRLWNRRTKEDFWQRELQHIGQQEVLNKEIYMEHTTPEGVFGYIDRYEEYRRQPSRVSGEFQTSDLNFWHMARSLGADPALNASFVQCSPTDRVFAEQTKDALWIMCNHSVQARRLVAKQGTSFIF